jgi:hypothetical protein
MQHNKIKSWIIIFIIIIIINIITAEQENIGTEDEGRDKRLEKTVKLGALQLVPFSKYYYDKQMNEDKTYSTHGWDEKCIQSIGQKTWRQITL